MALAGIEWMLFSSVTHQTAPLVVFPGYSDTRVMRHIVAVTCVTISSHHNNSRILGEARA
jgi:hypothetical protein